MKMVSERESERGRGRWSGKREMKTEGKDEGNKWEGKINRKRKYSGKEGHGIEKKARKYQRTRNGNGERRNKEKEDLE